MNHGTVLITGGTGMIGKALTKALLDKGYDVIVLTRNPSKQSVNTSKLSYAGWDPEKQEIDKDAITRTDYVIHLAGAGIADKRWTNKRKKEILESRTKSSALLIKAMKENINKVKVVVSASAIGWYGPDPQVPNPHPFAENAAANNDFLGETCRKWEESIEPVAQLGKRLVKLRTGIVLSKEDGMVKEFLKPLWFGIAPILGSGKQVISWIHIDDIVRAYIHAIENVNMNGVYNAVSPHPVTNKNFVLQLATAVRGKFFIPFYVPSFVLKLMKGELSIEVLKSATVSSNKIHSSGFTFIHPTIESALRVFR
jgi:uncharacterized protein